MVFASCIECAVCVLFCFGGELPVAFNPHNFPYSDPQKMQFVEALFCD